MKTSSCMLGVLSAAILVAGVSVAENANASWTRATSASYECVLGNQNQQTIAVGDGQLYVLGCCTPGETCCAAGTNCTHSNSQGFEVFHWNLNGGSAWSDTSGSTLALAADKSGNALAFSADNYIYEYASSWSHVSGNLQGGYNNIDYPFLGVFEYPNNGGDLLYYSVNQTLSTIPPAISQGGTTLSGLSFGGEFSLLAIDEGTLGTIFAVNVRPKIVNPNNGNIVNAASMPIGVHPVSICAYDGLWAAGSDGYLYSCSGYCTSSSSWTEVSPSTPGITAVACDTANGNIYAVANSGYVYKWN